MWSIFGCFSPSSSVAPAEPKQLTPKEVHDLETNPEKFVKDILKQLEETNEASKRKLAKAWERHAVMRQNTAKIATCMSTSLY